MFCVDSAQKRSNKGIHVDEETPKIRQAAAVWAQPTAIVGSARDGAAATRTGGGRRATHAAARTGGGGGATHAAARTRGGGGAASAAARTTAASAADASAANTSRARCLIASRAALSLSVEGAPEPLLRTTVARSLSTRSKVTGVPVAASPGATSNLTRADARRTCSTLATPTSSPQGAVGNLRSSA